MNEMDLTKLSKEDLIKLIKAYSSPTLRFISIQDHIV